MNPQTPVLKRRSDGLDGEWSQSKIREGLHAEARPESGDPAGRSHATKRAYTSLEPKQEGHKRKRSFVNQQRSAKRAHCTVAQPTHLTASALQSVQSKQKEVEHSQGSEASQGKVLSVQR